MNSRKLKKAYIKIKARLTDEILGWYYASPLTFKETFIQLRTGRVFPKEISRKELYNKVSKIYRQGWLEKKVIEDRIYYAITNKGRVKYLTYKLQTADKQRGKQATIIIFDIPEEKRTYRNFLRRLLKQMKFTQIQKSVLIAPYVLPKEFYDLLKEMDLLRFVKVIEGKIRF